MDLILTKSTDYTADDWVCFPDWREELIQALTFHDADGITALFSAQEQENSTLKEQAQELCDAFTGPVLYFDQWCDSLAKDEGLKRGGPNRIHGTFYSRTAEGAYYVYLHGTVDDDSDDGTAGLHQIDFVPEKAQAMYEAGQTDVYAGPDSYADNEQNGIHIISDEGLTQAVCRIDGQPLFYTLTDRTLTQSDVIIYVQEEKDLSWQAFEDTFGAANASADGAAEETQIQNAVRYYYQLSDAPELYTELTVVDGQIVLIRRLQARSDTWELVPTGSEQEQNVHDLALGQEEPTDYYTGRLLEVLQTGDQELAKSLFAAYTQQTDGFDQSLDTLFQYCAGTCIREIPDRGGTGRTIHYPDGVRYYACGTVINVENSSGRYRLRLKISTEDSRNESAAVDYIGIVQVELLTADFVAAERADLIRLDDYRTQEMDDQLMTYGIQFYEDASLSVNPVLIEGCYCNSEENSQTLSLDDILSYCREGQISTAEEFVTQFGTPLYDDRNGSGSFSYRISEGDELYLDILTDIDKKVVKISTVDAYGYSVMYYDGISQ